MSQDAGDPVALWAELTEKLQHLSDERAALVAGRIDALCVLYGSRRKLAKAIGVDHVYLHHLRKGTKRNPSDEVLAKLGLTS